jgi:hypothetical protein
MTTAPCSSPLGRAPSTIGIGWTGLLAYNVYVALGSVDDLTCCTACPRSYDIEAVSLRRQYLVTPGDSSGLGSKVPAHRAHHDDLQLVAPPQPLLDDAVHDLLGRFLLAPGLAPPSSWSLFRCCFNHCRADLLKVQVLTGFG